MSQFSGATIHAENPPPLNSSAPASTEAGSILGSLFSGIEKGLGKAQSAVEAVTPPSVQEPVKEQPAEPAAEEKIAPEAKSDKKGMDALLEGEEDAKPKAEEKDDAADAPEGTAETPKAKNAWTTLKKEAGMVPGLQAELAALKAQLSDRAKLQDADPLKKQIEELTAQRDELQKKAYAFDITQSPEWDAAVTAPIKTIMDAARGISSRSGVDERQLLGALEETDVKRQDELLAEITTDMTERERVRVFDLANKVSAIQDKRDQLLRDSDKAYEEIKTNSQKAVEERKTAARAEEMRAVAEHGEKLLKIASQFTLGDGKAAIQEIMDAANAVPFDELPANEKAFAAVSASALPMMQKVLKGITAERDSLKKEIAKLTGTAPGASQGAKPQEAATQKDPNMGFLESLGIR